MTLPDTYWLRIIMQAFIDAMVAVQIKVSQRWAPHQHSQKPVAFIARQVDSGDRTPGERERDR